jgi:hypothetical protein
MTKPKKPTKKKTIGRPNLNNRDTTLNVRLKSELKDVLREISEEEGISVSDIVERIVKKEKKRFREKQRLRRIKER